MLEGLQLVGLYGPRRKYIMPKDKKGSHKKGLARGGEPGRPVYAGSLAAP